MEQYRVSHHDNIHLSSIDPESTSGFSGKKEDGLQKLKKLNLELESLQELLYAEQKHRILVILQGMDTSGKDGVVRHVFEGVNPQGVKVVSFKEPTQEELGYDYLWRVHQQVPKNGELAIFNRSHYEDVLIVRVHELVDKQRWERRYEQINQFERMLTEEGTTILKFFLHISLDEQKNRLEDRLKDGQKLWKFSVSDLKERTRWADYMSAYEDVLNKTSTANAPWYIVPANKKWYRNLVIASVIVKKLKDLGMAYPQPMEDLSNIVVE